LSTRAFGAAQKAASADGVEWENLVREQPWFSIVADHRIDSVPNVIVGLSDACVYTPADVQAQREDVGAAAEHCRTSPQDTP
jgi:hypothetical protein